MSIILEAHRGVSSDYPENTMAAFRAAVSLGYGMIELDTKFTADDRCIILHDGTLNRTARREDGSPLETEAPASSLALSEIRKLDAGAWFGSKFAGERVPTLEEALELALETGIPLKFDNVMWKHFPHQRRIMLETIENMGALDKAGFTVGTVEQAQELIERFPGAQVHFDGMPDAENIAALSGILPREQLTVWLRYHNECTAWCKTPAATKELADSVRPFAKIGLWLLTSKEELREAERIGADYVETDGSLKP